MKPQTSYVISFPTILIINEMDSLSNLVLCKMSSQYVTTLTTTKNLKNREVPMSKETPESVTQEERDILEYLDTTGVKKA